MALHYHLLQLTSSSEMYYMYLVEIKNIRSVEEQEEFIHVHRV